MYIDIRNKNEYFKSHIEGAININYYDLLINYNKYLDRNKIYYIYCNSGLKSRVIVSKLNKLGYNCVNIEGGYNNYLLKDKKI